MSSDTRMTEAIAATTRWQSCAIVEIATRTPAIKSFFLSLSETFDHTAGQHVDVRLTAPNGHTAMRSYSIASAPSDSKVIELAIERLPDGDVSPFFPDIALGLAVRREPAMRSNDFSRRIDAPMVADVAARLGVAPGCVFVCGSNAFVDIAADAALALRPDAGAIKTERYGT